MAHTPGPWKLEDSNVITAEFEGERVQIALLTETRWSFPDGGKTRRLADHRVDNGQLMIAAPDLLAALEAVEWVEDENGKPYCPECDSRPNQHHAPNCRLAATLAKARRGDAR